MLEVLSEFNHPVGIVTKSALVLRDIDILTSMAERGLVKVALSVTTLDPKLARSHGAARRDAAETPGGSGACSRPRAFPPWSWLRPSFRR